MHGTITRDELRQEIEEGGTTVVEALPPMYFEERHLPGALNIPHDRVRELGPALLPDRDARIVTYCANTPCQNSGIAAATLVAMGYTDVREYVEGKQDWVDAGLPVEVGAPAVV
jgi:rhodanese-related sulfurtransferase